MAKNGYLKASFSCVFNVDNDNQWYPQSPQM